jgi:integrase
MSAKPAVPGDGSIFPYKGKWAAYVWVITPTGEKARKWLYGDKREDIEPEFNELKVKAAKATIPTSTPTVEEYLTYWLAEVIKPNREDGTYSQYELMSRLHIIPGIGKKPIDPKKLTVRACQTWINKVAVTCQCCAQQKDAKRRKPRCCAIGKCCGDYPGTRTISAARGTLRAALNHAKREELLDRNVAELVTLPKARKRNRRRDSWTVDEARKFLECSRAEGDPLYPLWVLILVLGLRKGEALGLVEPDAGWRFADDSEALVDLEWQLQHVGGQPLKHKPVLKADGSTDTLPLPSIVLNALRLAARYREEARADNWPDICICGKTHKLAFLTSNGLPHSPRNVNSYFDRRCKRYGIRRITIHDTRRTCGSLLAALGVHPRVAMAILRHSRIALTMEIYTQVPTQETRDALQRLSDQLDHRPVVPLADLDGLADADPHGPDDED